MAIMRGLKESGTTIVFITHKLREVREVADKITVIRLGKVVGEAKPTAGNTELDALMVRSEEHTSALQSLMRNTYAVFCLQKNNYLKRTTYDDLFQQHKKAQLRKAKITH